MVGYLGICHELNTFDVELGTDAETVQCKSDCFAVIFLSFPFSLFSSWPSTSPRFLPSQAKAQCLWTDSNSKSTKKYP